MSLSEYGLILDKAGNYLPTLPKGMLDTQAF